MKTAVFIMGCMLSMHCIFAQDFPKKNINLSNLVDEIFAVQDLDINYEDLYENFAQLLSTPLDLNLATDEQLRALYILKQSQIHSIIQHREDSGPFISIYELQTLPEIDRDTFLKLVPFVTVSDPGSKTKTIIHRVIQNENNYLLLRWSRTLEKQSGYQETIDTTKKYQGSPDKLYFRMRASKPGDFSMGITGEKDPGEALVWNQKNKGFDFLSYHLQFQNKGKIQNIIVGDYRAQFGQGIALGSVFGIGKNAETVTTLRRSNIGFVPYTSLYESGYFRGASISYALVKNITLHGFLSGKRSDAPVKKDTLTDSGSFVSSISQTGLHRTTAERAAEKTIAEQNTGVIVQYKNKSLDGGLLIHQTHFNVSLNRSPSIYNQFYFNGNTNTNVGGFLNYNWSNFTFFSEYSQSINYGRAFVGGMLGSLTPKLDIAIHLRNYDKNYYSFYSNAISENAAPQNESGIYWGWKYQFNKKYSLSGYADLFQFPWLHYRSYAPSDGTEWLLRFNYQPSKTVKIFLQAREESKIKNGTDDTNIYQTASTTKRNFWVNADYAATPRLSFRTRAQFSKINQSGSITNGTLFLQDANFDLKRFSVTARLALFDTDDYDNRMYVYEPDVWLAFTFPAYYGKGIHQLLMLEYQPIDRITFWLRWGQTRYTDRSTIGSAGELIQGNTRNDLKFQVRFKL